jgi:peptidoglycan/xylan/chitin deacetylase (PgdA/CDA1 family)
MAASDSIAIASHGFTHSRLDVEDADLDTEIVLSRKMLSARTGRTVDAFVLPYGRFSPRTIACAKEHYRYVFRIGSADNRGWSGEILYRVDADEMSSPSALFSRERLSAYRWRRRWNAMRSR